jgi:hypothetical protein
VNAHLARTADPPFGVHHETARASKICVCMYLCMYIYMVYMVYMEYMICMYVCMAVGQIPRSPVDMKIAGSPGSLSPYSLW